MENVLVNWVKDIFVEEPPADQMRGKWGSKTGLPDKETTAWSNEHAAVLKEYAEKTGPFAGLDRDQAKVHLDTLNEQIDKKHNFGFTENGQMTDAYQWMKRLNAEGTCWINRCGPYKNLTTEEVDALHQKRVKQIDDEGPLRKK